MATVKQSNPKAFEALDVKLKQLQGYEGRTGFFSTEHYPDGTPVAYVAAIQELGYGPIPPRPFMRPAVVKNKTKWKDVAAQMAKSILAGQRTGQEGMEVIAKVAAEDVKQSIQDVTSPPLTPLTLWLRYYRRQGKKITGSFVGEVAAKIHSGQLRGLPAVNADPLKDTKQMINSVKGEVVSA